MFMKEINLKDYENLRERQARLVGRIIPYESTQPVIYFTVNPDQQGLNAISIIEKLLLTHPYLKGQFDVIRHWTTPEIVTVKFRDE